jgi:phospholipase/lecithinase/hemolysin
MRVLSPALVAALAVLLAACGREEPPHTPTATEPFTRLVSFGDSLSDVGTYNVGAIRSAGGGKYTINGSGPAGAPDLTGKVWVEVLAADLGLPAPCPAQTGLEGDPARGFNVPVVKHSGCTGYAQGGARVIDPVGPGNRLTGSPLGATTVPVAAQVANHLAANGGRFSGSELVLVMAGGNDALTLLQVLLTEAAAAGRQAGSVAGARVRSETFNRSLASLLTAGATRPLEAASAVSAAIVAEQAREGSTELSVLAAAVAAAAAQSGNSAIAAPAVWGPVATQARSEAKSAADAATVAATGEAEEDYIKTHGPALVGRMIDAGAELASIVRGQIVDKGATRVLVNNLPDLSATPSIKILPGVVRSLVDLMVAGFNNALRLGLGSDSRIMLFDVFGITHDQSANPAKYGLTDIDRPACGPNFLGGSSLACTVGTLGSSDAARYMFADEVHPTPYEHALVAREVRTALSSRGWIAAR